MGIGNLGCALCGGQRARKTRPVGIIACTECDNRVCERHARWMGESWWCKRCVRRAKVR